MCSSVDCVCFFKQKTAYEVEYGLVGLEMWIRDRAAVPVGQSGAATAAVGVASAASAAPRPVDGGEFSADRLDPVSYTHLTLPAGGLGKISGGAGSFKKKKMD